MLSDYATEHFEIASYRALIKGAQDLGDDETVRLCQQILREEEDMARFLEQNLPTAVHDVLSRKAAEHREAGRS
jgi:ferritin-like metal-binding protein YciE